MPLVLILTNPSDNTADRVSVALRDRGAKAVRFDTGEFPLGSRIVCEFLADALRHALIMRDWGPNIHLSEVGSVWYRRPTQFRVNPLLQPHEQRFARSEAAMAVGGIMRQLDCFWMNHPASLVEARYKVAQLSVAARSGLRIPRSLITNDPAQLRRFLQEVPAAVIKTLGYPAVNGTEDDPVESGLVPTSAIDASADFNPDQVSHTACLVQERIPKAYDLRVTVVGSQIFPVAIASQEDPRSAVDWRIVGPGLRHEVVTLPAEVEAGLQRMMRVFQLHYAAIDMVLTPDGDYVFLEVNPNGEWEWLEKHAGVPISGAIADLLIASASAERATSDFRADATIEGIVT